MPAINGKDDSHEHERARELERQSDDAEGRVPCGCVLLVGSLAGWAIVSLVIAIGARVIR